MILLLGVGGVIFFLMICLMLRNHLVYVRPLNRLHQYASELKPGKSVPQSPPRFTGMLCSEIQSSLNLLAQGVETHMRDRHKFILDIVADLKTPLTCSSPATLLLDG